MPPRIYSLIAWITVPLLLGATLLGCGKAPPPVAPPEPPVVTVAHPREITYAPEKEFTGRLTPVETLELRSQVTGYLSEVKFKDGDIVHPGDLLFVIDERPFKAVVDKDEAEIAKAQANLDNAEKRKQIADNSGLSMSKEEKIQRSSDFLTAQASLKGAQAQLESATRDLEYCRIKATFGTARIPEKKDEKKEPEKNSTIPTDGRITRTYVTKGNLVTAGQTLLATITTIDPIYCYFDVDEATCLWYRKQIIALENTPNPLGSKRLRARLELQNEENFPHLGEVDYIGATIDRSTGTIEVRAIFQNPRHEAKNSPAIYDFVPGDSARIRIEAGAPRKVIAIPETAIGSEQGQRLRLHRERKERGGLPTGHAWRTHRRLADHRLRTSSVRYRHRKRHPPRPSGCKGEPQVRDPRICKASTNPQDSQSLDECPGLAKPRPGLPSGRPKGS